MSRIDYESKPIVTNISLLVVTDGNGRFLLDKLPDNFNVESVRGKLDLPKQPYEGDSTALEIGADLGDEVFQLTLDPDQMDIIGYARYIRRYKHQGCRDMRRTYVGVWVDPRTIHLSKVQGYDWYSLNTLLDKPKQVCGSEYLEMLDIYQQKRAGLIGGNLRRLMPSVYDLEDEGIARYVTEHAWPKNLS